MTLVSDVGRYLGTAQHILQTFEHPTCLTLQGPIRYVQSYETMYANLIHLITK